MREMDSDPVQPRTTFGQDLAYLFGWLLGMQPSVLVQRPLFPSVTSGLALGGGNEPLLASQQEDAADLAAHQRYQLILQFAVSNLAAFSLLGAAYAQGWIALIVEADTTFISVGIFFVFLGGLAACARETWTVSAELDSVRAQKPDRYSWTEQFLISVAGRDAGSRAILANALRTKLGSRIAIVRYVANTLVLLGLIGTVLGFVIALSAIEPASASDVTKVGPMVAKLVEGMSVAIYTTLVGSVLHLWLTANYHMLAVGVARYATAVIARGEEHARI